MDAVTENRFDYEVIGFIKQVAKVYNLDITIETEPSENGGLRKRLKIVFKEEDSEQLTTTNDLALLQLPVFGYINYFVASAIPWLEVAYSYY